MDLGATICSPRSPACGIGPLRDPCVARVEGTAAELPKKEPKKPKPTRLGTAYVALREDGALLWRRGRTKFLGGMLGWPTDWSDAPAPPAFEADGKHQCEARHTYTFSSNSRYRVRSRAPDGDLSTRRIQAMPHLAIRFAYGDAEVYDLVQNKIEAAEGSHG